MGKCKKRSLHKSNTAYSMTREVAVSNLFKMMEDTRTTGKKRSKKSKKDFDFQNILSTISLFGISAEELSEAGVTYENLKAFSSVLS